MYSVEAQWVKCEQRGKSVVLLETPRLDRKKKPAAKQAEPEKKVERPYPAIVTKGKLLELVGKMRMEKKTCTDKQDKAFKITYASLWPVDTYRYAVTKWLFNKSSTNELDDAEKLALIKWMEWEAIEEGGYIPSQDAVSEAQIMYRHVEKEQGQQELL